MDVIQVTPLYYPCIGGVETHVREISQRLDEIGINVKIFTTDPSGKLPKKEIIDGIQVYRFKAYSPKHIYFFSPDLFRHLKKSQADLVHVHAFPNFPALAAALSKKGKPLVFTPHYGGYTSRTIGSSYLFHVGKKIYNDYVGGYLFNKSDAIILLSQFEENILNSKYKVNSNKIFNIPNGIDQDLYDTSIKNNSERTILYVGRIEEYKGINHIMKSFVTIKDAFSDAKLIIVGTGSYKNELKSTVNNSKYSNSIFLYENIPKRELLELYCSSSIFILPSQYEGLPISLMEAMASGLPVIASNVGGIPDVVESGKNGFLLEYPIDVEYIINYISMLFSDNALYQKMSVEAKNTILYGYSWDVITHKLLKLYKNLL